MTPDDFIERIKPFQPERIILFGSHTSGNTHTESDLDVLIIKNTKQRYHDRLIDVRRLLRTTTPVDVFVLTEEELQKERLSNPFIQEILSKGKVIYG